jgi:hypothetical protein
MTAQATAQAHWSRAYRQRRKAGRIVVELEVDEAKITAALIEARLLSPLLADDRAELDAEVASTMQTQLIDCVCWRSITTTPPIMAAIAPIRVVGSIQ